MHAVSSSPTLREIVALFDDEEVLNDVVEELQIAGFNRSELAVLPSWKVVERTLGREPETVAELEDDPNAPRAVPIDRASLGFAQGACIAAPLYLGTCGAMLAFAAGGAAFATIAVAGIATGAMGAVLGIVPLMWMRKWHRQYIEDLLGRGGLVLWVETPEEKCEERAKTILSSHFARDVHSHGGTHRLRDRRNLSPPG